MSLLFRKDWAPSRHSGDSSLSPNDPNSSLTRISACTQCTDSANRVATGQSKCLANSMNCQKWCCCFSMTIPTQAHSPGSPSRAHVIPLHPRKVICPQVQRSSMQCTLAGGEPGDEARPIPRSIILAWLHTCTYVNPFTAKMWLATVVYTFSGAFHSLISHETIVTLSPHSSL